MSALPPRIGPYRVLRLLAQGGMGRVYLAQDMRLGRVVALKMAHAELAERAEARAQFLVEARATARLAHPNVVPVFDVGEHLGAPWAAYEFVEGRTLKQRLREGPLPLAEARRVMTEIASAVEAAHADGIGPGTSSCGIARAERASGARACAARSCTSRSRASVSAYGPTPGKPSSSICGTSAPHAASSCARAGRARRSPGRRERRASPRRQPTTSVPIDVLGAGRQAERKPRSD